MAGTDSIESDQKFPPADVDGTLNPGNNKQVQVDPVSSEVAERKVPTYFYLSAANYLQNKNVGGFASLFFFFWLVSRTHTLFSLLFCCNSWSIGLKEQAETKEKKKEKEKEDAMHTIKSAIIISGIVVAVVGAVFAITKKLREKWPFLTSMEEL